MNSLVRAFSFAPHAANAIAYLPKLVLLDAPLILLLARRGQDETPFIYYSVTGCTFILDHRDACLPIKFFSRCPDRALRQSCARTDHAAARRGNRVRRLTVNAAG